jgi:tetratricopeptide (TPR) repeat protein
VATIGLQLCLAYGLKGSYSKTAELAPRVITLLEAAHGESESLGGLLNLHSAIVSGLGLALGCLGDFEEGRAQCEKGLTLASRMNEPSSMGVAEHMLGVVFFVRGDSGNAIEHLENAVKYADEAQAVTISIMARPYLGGAYVLSGEPETARQQLEEAIRQAQSAEAAWHLAVLFRHLAWVHFESGDLESALRCAEESDRIAESGTHVEAVSKTWLGRILARYDPARADEAAQQVLQGVSTLDRLKLRPFSSQGQLLLGELYADTGQKDKALETLKRAESEFKDMGMDHFLRRTQEVLARVEGAES